MKPLGYRMQVAGFALAGRITPGQALELEKAVIAAVGMRTGGLSPRIWTFPFNGAGGEGETILFPAHITTQPLLESFATVTQPGLIGIDSWKEHDLFYLLIHSCRPFCVEWLRDWLKAHYEVINYHTFTIGRPQGKRLSGLRHLWGRLWNGRI